MIPPSFKKFVNPVYQGVNALWIVLLFGIAVFSRSQHTCRFEYEILFFIPAWFYALTGGLLTLVGIRLKREPASLVSAGFIATVLFVCYTGFYLPAPLPSESGAALENRKTLGILTSNHGESKDSSITDFIDACDPDVVMIQSDSKFSKIASSYTAIYPYHAKRKDFFCMSRFPLLGVEELARIGRTSGEVIPLGIRVQVKLPQYAPFTIYSVHLPSPSESIKGVLSSLARLNLEDALERLEVETKARSAAIQTLLYELSHQQQPWILCGDLNSTPLCPLPIALGEKGYDAFAEAGLGFGFTFPGRSDYKLGILGPLSRIDYIFCSQDFYPIEATVEPTDSSEHCSVYARLRLPIRIQPATPNP